MFISVKVFQNKSKSLFSKKKEKFNFQKLLVVKYFNKHKLKLNIILNKERFQSKIENVRFSN